MKADKPVMKPAVEEVDLPKAVRDFLMNGVLPFHTMLSRENMKKENQRADFDVVIDRLAQINTLLSTYTREKAKK